MADDADMRNELSDMQQRADQLADEVRTHKPQARVQQTPEFNSVTLNFLVRSLSNIINVT